MNSLLCNITLISLMTFNYSPSPFFAGIRSNLYMKEIKIDRSFSTFSYNNRYFELKKSKFFNFFDSIVNIDKNIMEFNGTFLQGINFTNIRSNVSVVDSLFYNISGNSIIQNNDDIITICILNSQFVNNDNNKINGNAIDLQGGTSLLADSLCFYNLQFNSLLKVNVFLFNKIQLNQSTILQTNSENSLIDCTNCMFDVHNLNFTNNKQNSDLMVFSSVEYFYIDYLNLMNSISRNGFLFTDHINFANFTYINVYNYQSNVNSFIFYLEKGSIYVFLSSFNTDKNIVYVDLSAAFFFKCNASFKFNSGKSDAVIRSIECLESVSSDLLMTANPDSFSSLLYCKDGSYPVLNNLQINEIRKKSENVQQKGATEILGIILLSILSVCIVAIVIWLILYFVVFKNPLREFDDDDEMEKWKQRWKWILEKTNRFNIEHAECSDMELDPIELSEDAIKKRNQKSYEGINQLSEGDNIVNEDFGGESFIKKKNVPKTNKMDETNDFDSQVSFKEDEGEVFNAYDTKNQKTITFQDSVFDNPDKMKNDGKEANYTEDDLSKNKNDLKKSKSLKIHFLSSDEVDANESSDIISESDDMDVDNDKINKDLKKTKSAWNRIQKAKIDKALGTVDESSESSWKFKHKKLKLTLNPIEESDSDNIWSDDGKVEKKDKNKKVKRDDDDDGYDGYGYNDDDDDDDDIWSESQHNAPDDDDMSDTK